MKNYHWFVAILVAVISVVSCDLQNRTTEFNITSGTQLSVMAEDTIASFNYEIVNVVEGGEISVSLENVDWIKDYDIVEHKVSGTINLHLLENESIENRSEVITVTYSYNGKAIVEGINVIQSTREYDYDYEAQIAVCNYWGLDTVETNKYAYDLYFGQGDLTMESQGEAYYALEFLTDEPGDGFYLKEGVYNVCQPGQYADFTINPVYSLYLSVGDASEEEDYDVVAYFSKGQITVEREGNIFTIYGYLRDREHHNHKIYYSGEMGFQNKTVESTLKGDVDMDLSKATIQAYFYGGEGVSSWMLSIGQEDRAAGSSMLQIQLAAKPESNYENGLATETFVFDTKNESAVGTFYRGVKTESYSGSWYYTSAGLDDGVLLVVDPAGPFRGGEIKIERVDRDKINLQVDVVDDAGNKITASGNNIPVLYVDYSEDTRAVASVQSVPFCRE